MSEPIVEPVVTADPSADTPPAMGPNGYPLATKPDAMTAEHQAAFYKHMSRQTEDRLKAANGRVKELEPAAKQLADLEAASRTEAEKAIEAARTEAEKAGRTAAEQEALGKFAPRLVGAEFRAQLAGRMTAEQITLLVGGLNVGQFLTEEGDVDSEKVAAFVGAIPAAVVPKEPLKPGALGAGRRDSAQSAGTDRGKELWQQNHPKKTTSA